MTIQQNTALCTKSKQTDYKGNLTCTCLTQGVEVEPGNPNLFWSAAEDGTVRQYDARLPSNDQKAWESCNCLLSVKAAGNASRCVELKGISLNKVFILNKCHNFPMGFLTGEDSKARWQGRVCKGTGRHCSSCFRCSIPHATVHAGLYICKTAMHP